MHWNFSLLFATWSQKSRLVILLLHSFNWFISTFYLLYKSLLKNQVYLFLEIGCVAPATFQVFVNNQTTLCRIFQHWRKCMMHILKDILDRYKSNNKIYSDIVVFSSFLLFQIQYQVSMPWYLVKLFDVGIEIIEQILISKSSPICCLGLFNMIQFL